MANSTKSANSNNKKSTSITSMKLPTRVISTYGKKNKQVIRSYVGVKNDDELLLLSIALGINLGRKKNEKLERAYKFWGDDINKEIEQQQEIKRTLKKVKQKQIRSNSVVLDFNSDNLLVSLNRLKHFYNGLAKVYKKGRNINVYKKRIGGGQELEFNDNFRIAFNYRFTDKLSDDFKIIFSKYIQIDSEQDKITHDTDYTIYINVGEPIKPKQMKQYFKQGTTNCFFLPIIDWAGDKLENAKSKGTKDRYRALYNKLIKHEEKYRASGVSEEDMNFLANEYQINIEVNTPFQKSFIICKSNKKALTTFKYINTKIDHIDHNKIVNLESYEVSQEKINEIARELIKNDEYFTYNKNMFGYRKISTLEASYVVRTPYKKCIDDFERDTGLINCFLDDIDDVDISEFVRQGVHFNETIVFKDDLYIGDEEHKLNDKYSNFNHIDMSKAYSNFHLSKYFKGFLGKPTDLRKCDSIVDLGYYKIENINFDNATPILKTYNEKMNIYSDNIYPSPELDFLKEHGVSFDIVAGCWGINTDFRFTDEMIYSKDLYPDEPSWYARYTGSMFCKNLYNDFYVKGDKKLAEHLSCYEDDIVDYNEYTQEIQVSYKKQHNNHLSHICGFITAYMRLNVMEQLLNMNPENIIKVVVDGIYYMGDTELYNCFTYEDKETITRNSDSGSYISNSECDLCIDYADYREHYLTELHKGVGGSGKTHLNIYDKGLLRKLFIAPSWKLSRNKNRECGINNEVWANLLSDDVEKINYFKRRYSTLIFDEISMMSNSAKEKIFKTYCDCKIIFCGDPGFQLPQFNKNEEPIELTGFQNVIEYTENRRCKCPELLKVLTFCRDNINNPNLFNMVKNALPTITKEELKKEYTIKDMILTRSIEKRDFYTSLLPDKKKYYVLKTDRNYCKGEILYRKPHQYTEEEILKYPEYHKNLDIDFEDFKTCLWFKKDYKKSLNINDKETIITKTPSYVEGVDYKVRNAYTIHSIQGETAKNKLYIHNSYMEATAVYTALSRAEYLDQIKLII